MSDQRKIESERRTEELVDDLIDAYLSQLVASDGPGGAVAVAEAGQPIHLRGYGLANVEHDVPWTANTGSRLASVTKHFLAAAVLLLVGERQISLDEPVSRYLTWLPDYAKNLSIRSFLNNTSGLRDDEALMGLSGISDDTPCTEAYLQKLAIRQHALNFSTGRHCLYTNTPFRFLARLIETLSGLSFGDFMRTKLLEPLGMESSRIAGYHSELIKGLAAPYQIDAKGKLVCVLQGTEYSGDGALISTATDMLRWNENLRKNILAIPGFPKVLLQRPEFSNPDPERYYGLGTVVQPIDGMPSISHVGAMGGQTQRIN